MAGCATRSSANRSGKRRQSCAEGEHLVRVVDDHDQHECDQQDTLPAPAQIQRGGQEERERSEERLPLAVAPVARDAEGGVNVGAFSFINGLLLRPLYHGADDVVEVHGRRAAPLR